MSLKLTFLGAADTVTGSRTLLKYRGKSWLVDCGLFQGEKSRRQRNWQPFKPDPSTLSGVILTHAHLDHSGYLPKLVKEGFSGPIYATNGTADLLHILLLDAAHLEEEAAGYANKTGYSHHQPALPLFTTEDAEAALTHVRRVERSEWLQLSEGISIRFLRAGHIIGASLVQIAVDLPDGTKTITFTGDLGHNRSHILRGPDTITSTDALVIESTYGDRLQNKLGVLEHFAAIITKTMSRRGVLVIPAFAVGRAQEIIYMIRLLEDRNLIPKVPVILDSPMAIHAMDICLRHPEDHILNSAFAEPFYPALFETSSSPDDSMLVCMREGPFIVISASGMLSGGRILQHLKKRLPHAENTVMFSGYQAEGSKGRFLQDNAGSAATLRIHHQEIPIDAEIVTLDTLSAHGDYEDILSWIETMSSPPPIILINHGEAQGQLSLKEKIAAKFGVEAKVAVDQSDQDITIW